MLRFSLRQLLMLTVFVALAVLSFKYVSPGWERATLGLVATIFFGAVIVALVGRGPGQAFAIGLAVVMAGYGYFKIHEVPPTSVNFGMPTTYLLVQLVWATEDAMSIKHALPIGHNWFALLFGYLGGCFARFVYLRRPKEQVARSKE